MSIETHITQVFHVADKVALGIDQLVDGFLTALLFLVDTVRNLLRDSVDPESASFLRGENGQQMKVA